MSWTTTSKSVEKSNFFKQLPKIFKGFWKQMLISLLALVRAFIPLMSGTGTEGTALRTRLTK